MERIISVGLVASLGFSIVNGCSSPERSFDRNGASGSSGAPSVGSGGGAGKATTSGGGHAGKRDGSDAAGATDAGAAGATDAGAGGVIDEPNGEAGRAQGGSSTGTGGMLG